MSLYNDQFMSGTKGYGGGGGYGHDYDDGYGHSGYGGHGGGHGGGCVISPEQWLGAFLIAGAGVAVAGAAFAALFITLTGGKRKRRGFSFLDELLGKKYSRIFFSSLYVLVEMLC